MSRLHIIVPAATGGLWDQTARAVADGLTRARLAGEVTLEHVSGNLGARAIGYLVSTGERQHDTLLVSSTPIMLRALRGATPSYRELAPVACMVGEHRVIAVRRDSGFADMAALLAALRRDPAGLRLAGGSVRGGSDHVLMARIGAAAGLDPKRLVYLPYDAGGAAIGGLASRQFMVLSAGVGELLAAEQGSELRLLAVSAPDRVAEIASVPTLRELGLDVTFTDWRGFFGPPQVPLAKADAHSELLGRLAASEEWRSMCAAHGWRVDYRPRAAFKALLDAEEAAAKRALADLGIA